MDNAVPYEIIAAPYEVWIADAGVDFPAVDEEPDSSDWTLLGSSGPENYTEEGVSVQHGQTQVDWRGLANTGPRKVFRTEENQIIGVTIADLTLEQYRQALNGNAVTNTPAAVGVPGTKKIGLRRGLTVKQYALLVRGPSPYMENGVAQYEVPICVESGSPQPTSTKSSPAALALQFKAVEDPDADSADERFGRYVAQTEEADT